VSNLVCAVLFLAGLGGITVGWLLILTTMDSGPEWLTTAGLRFGQVSGLAALVGLIGGLVHSFTG